jgi:hypothetical protein
MYRFHGEVTREQGTFDKLPSAQCPVPSAQCAPLEKTDFYGTQNRLFYGAHWQFVKGPFFSRDPTPRTRGGRSGEGRRSVLWSLWKSSPRSGAWENTAREHHKKPLAAKIAVEIVGRMRSNAVCCSELVGEVDTARRRQSEASSDLSVSNPDFPVRLNQA